MQFLPVLLAIVGSTAWLAVDASKRDWSDNGFAKNVPTWVVGSLLLWIVVFPMYVFVHRKKAPLLEGAKPKAKAKGRKKAKDAAPVVEPVADVQPEPVEIEPAPVVAMAAIEPSEQYGPSLDEVELAAPEPVVEIEREPVVESEREPVVELEPIVAFEPEPDPVPELEPEPVVELEPIVALEPLPVADPEPELEPEPEPAPEPVLEISHPELPAEQAPPGLSVDAFKDIKPVAFGGVAADEPEPEPLLDAEPAPDAAPASDAQPVVEPEPEPIAEPVVEPELEPVVEPRPDPLFQPVSYPELDTEPAFAPEPAFEPDPEPEPALAAAVAAPADEPKPKKRGLRLPNPELKLPSFGKKKRPKTVAAAPDAPKASKPKRGPKLPQITLPPNLQGPLNDVERKIALGSVVAIVAAAAFGYSTAPADETIAPAPAPTSAAASR